MNIYWLGTGKISNFLNSLLHEVLGCAATIILMIIPIHVNKMVFIIETACVYCALRSESLNVTDENLRR